jgi:hypothetical protein
MLAQDIGYLLIAGVVGLALGILLASLLGVRSGKAPKTGEATPEMKKEGYADIAHLWYSPATKKIISEIDNEFFPEFANLATDQQKKAIRLSELFSNWVKVAPLAEDKPVADVSEKPVENYMEETVQQPVVASGRPGSTKPLPFVDIAPIENVPPSSYAAHEESTFNGDIEPFKPLDADMEAEVPHNLKPKTIAGQISDIIDEIIQTSPLREKGIKLIERADHGVDVWFGMEKFDGIEAIPYPEVKALIKTAAARWEREASAKTNLKENSKK